MLYKDFANWMNKNKWIIILTIILYGCRDNSTDCDELKDHPHLLELKLLGSVELELPENYAVNMSDCWGDGWGADAITIGDMSYTVSGAEETEQVGEIG